MPPVYFVNHARLAHNFTKASIEALQAPAQGRLLVHDEGGKQSVKGLVLRVTAAGTKTFQVYKWSGTKPVRVTLGKYPDLTVEMARRAAKQAIADLAGGGNPNAEKKVEKAKGVTLAEAVAAYQTTRPLKPTTIKDMNVALRHIAEDWMSRPLAKITPAMIEKRHREFAESRSPARANLGMRYLRAVFNFASAKYKDDKGQSLIPPNPVKILSDLKAWKRVDRRQTCIQPHQLQPWFEAVMNLPGEDWRDYFRLVLLTGLRREEALGLQWADVDFTGRTLTVRDTKNHSDHTLPLPAYLLDLLAKRKAARAARPMACQSEDVFADESGRRISNLRYAQVGVTRNSGVDFTVHDLRRSFATIAESLDIPAYALKCLLNHTQKSDVTSGYLVVTTERLREPMEKICSYILKATGQLLTAPVIPIRGTAVQAGGGAGE